MGRTACTEPQCLYKGALYLTVELYLYSPYGPYGLYSASVHAHGVHFPFTFTLNSKQRIFLLFIPWILSESIYPPTNSIDKIQFKAILETYMFRHRGAILREL